MIRELSFRIENVIFVEDFLMVILHARSHIHPRCHGFRFQSHHRLWIDISIPHLSLGKSSPQC